jgi:hypothetical protein
VRGTREARGAGSSAALRCSNGGCVENSANSPFLSVMPSVRTDSGSEDASLVPDSLRSAFTIGNGVPRYCAEPRSARNSRCRENQATISDATSPNTIWHTITVTK